MDVLLKVRTRSGEHTFREDIYTRTLKYRRWNNQLRLFCSLKRRVVDIFQKRNLFLDSSRSTSTQTIMNDVSIQCKTEDKDSETDSEKESIHSNWGDVVLTEADNPIDAVADIPQKKRTVRSIVLVPYKPKPKDWGSWKIRSPYATSTVASPSLNSSQDDDKQIQNSEGKLTYIPHSPYYKPVHSPQYYEDE